MAQPPATFKGRLRLDAFRYSSSEDVRRNPPRAAAAAAAATVATTTTATASLPQKPASSPRKRKRSAAAGYAPPSTYAHLPLLPDAIAPNLLVLFVGLNPGIATARTGHAYAHPSNLFWKLLHSSGVTPRRCLAEEDAQMPALYSLGLTNIVARPSRNGAELSRQEMDEGVAVLEEKARRWRPESMCIVGKSIWESIWRVRHGGRPVGGRFRYGWQDDGENMGVVLGGGDDDDEWPGARVFVASSTSGLAATLKPAQKEEIWAQLGSWVKTRRLEREREKHKERKEEKRREEMDRAQRGRPAAGDPR